MGHLFSTAQNSRTGEEASCLAVMPEFRGDHQTKPLHLMGPSSIPPGTQPAHHFSFIPLCEPLYRREQQTMGRCRTLSPMLIDRDVKMIWFRTSASFMFPIEMAICGHSRFSDKPILLCEYVSIGLICWHVLGPQRYVHSRIRTSLVGYAVHAVVCLGPLAIFLWSLSHRKSEFGFYAPCGVLKPAWLIHSYGHGSELDTHDTSMGEPTGE